MLGSVERLFRVVPRISIMTGNLPLVLGCLIGPVMLSSGHVDVCICCVILCIDVMEVFHNCMRVLSVIVYIFRQSMVVRRILMSSSMTILFS